MTDMPPFDDVDVAILDEIRAVYSLADPPPPGLDDRVRFAIALENLDVEVSRLQAEVAVGSGARGAERTRTITFDSESLTIMVSIVETTTGRVRLDGWLAPAGALRVELRIAAPDPRDRAASQEVIASESGRFVFDGVTHGLAQLLVHPSAGSGVDLPSSVVTPSLVL
jgi:hypothetical protein